MRLRTIFLVSFAATALSLWASPIAFASGEVAASSLGTEQGTTCSYIEAGDPGPAGNILRVEDRSGIVTKIFRDDKEIVVSFINGDHHPAACAGGTPTVFNVDRIEYSTTTGGPVFHLFREHAGFAPGATPEASGSEIEISVHEDRRHPRIKVGGSPASDTIDVGQLGADRVGLNLNPRADGANQDADVVLDAVDPSKVFVTVVGKSGDETLSALGGPEFSGPFPGDHLSLSGGDDDDTLIGGPHRDHLNGGLGNDTLIGGRGNDGIIVGPGRDRAEGGKGNDNIENVSDVGVWPVDKAPDRVLGGAGNDLILVDQLAGDFVDCGAGRRDLVGVDRHDRTKDCEIRS